MKTIPGILILLGLAATVCCVGDNKLIVILLDGFRWDYFKIDNLLAFPKIISNGVKARHMVPDYPAMSYPNYYTIMTGLHTETHGILGNNIYDTVTNKYFKYTMNESFWWEAGEPLWITATKHGKRVNLYHWPGCEPTIHNVKPQYCQPWVGSPTFQDFQTSAISSMDGFLNGTLDISMIYVEDPDDAGHHYGVFTTKLNETIRQVDAMLLYMMTLMETRGLDDKVNVIIVSDHGMTDVTPTKCINLTQIMPDFKDSFEHIVGGSVYTQIWPKPGMEDTIYNGFKGKHPHLQVFKKSEIPERLHYRNNPRQSPILFITDLGWTGVLGYGNDTEFPNYNGTNMLGNHGFDNERIEMGAIFLFYGPDAKKGLEIEPFPNVDLYELFCKLTGLTPSINNGTWSHLSNVIASHPYSSPSQTVVVLVVLLSVSGIIIFIVTIIILWRRYAGSHKHYVRAEYDG